MTKATAWAIVWLGLIHIVFGILRFNVPLLDAVNAGFFGQFAAPEPRRTAFWFIICGPLFMLAGHLAVHAEATADLRSLRLIGAYMLATSIVGVAAFPVSPLWAPLVLSLPLLASGPGWID